MRFRPKAPARRNLKQIVDSGQSAVDREEISLLYSFLFLLAFAQADAGEVSLRWQFKQGETFQQQTRSQLHQVVKVGEQELKQDLVHTTVIKYVVKQVDTDGSVTFEQTIESMKATTPEGAPAAGNNAILNQLQGATFTAKLGPDFKVLQLEGYDELVKRLAGDDPSVRRVVQALLSEDQLKNIMQQSFGFVPNTQAKPGATWQRDLTLALGPLGTMTLKQNFKFEGMETKDGKSLAKVTFQPQVTYSPPKPEAANPEMSVLKGEIKADNPQGILYFDPAAGRLDRSELKLHLTGTLTVKLSGKEVPLTFDQTQTIETRLLK